MEPRLRRSRRKKSVGREIGDWEWGGGWGEGMREFETFFWGWNDDDTVDSLCLQACCWHLNLLLTVQGSSAFALCSDPDDVLWRYSCSNSESANHLAATRVVWTRRAWCGRLDGVQSICLECGGKRIEVTLNEPNHGSTGIFATSSFQRRVGNGRIERECASMSGRCVEDTHLLKGCMYL